eukprot:CAMPEP_0197853154 /NCGR_PEP_ID=MMETSP1438-20131217/22192_1 /TAXON_ID=1461541 /ORGANISM="Pterosperma sp., Strain CCMP1384" /LENGTH=74 /DNA_ID=CAMNT_0043467459 /DNA_START=452 /DNA_END=674 /DNA_ORIENTATION=+
MPHVVRGDLGHRLRFKVVENEERRRYGNGGGAKSGALSVRSSYEPDEPARGMSGGGFVKGRVVNQAKSLFENKK